MNTRHSNLRIIFLRDIKPLFLLLFSVMGLMLGIILSYYNPGVLSELRGTELLTRPSLLHLLLINLIPVFLLFIIFRFSLSLLCYPLVFLLGVCSGYCEIALCYLFGDSAWLIRFFLLFSRYIALAIWWLLLFRCIRWSRTHLVRYTCFSVFMILVVTVFDVCVIAPFLSDIYNTI